MNDPKVAEALATGFAKGLTTGLGSALFIALVLVFLWFRYPNNAKLVIAQLWYLLSMVFGVVAERHYVVNRLEGTLGKGIENVARKVDGLEAQGIKVTLVRDAVREAFIRDRVLVMRIQKGNHGENLANIAVLYSEHLYSRMASTLDASQREGIRLYTAKSLLKSEGQEGLRELEEKYYRPLIALHPNMRAILNKLESIDNRGLFFSVFIQEMVFLGEKASFRQRVQGVHKEVEEFVDFLVAFANRSRGDQTVEHIFHGQNIKVAFVLVATKEKRLADATQNYIHYVENLPRDLESFYFMGWGDNIAFVRKVSRVVVASISNLELKKEKDYERSFEDGGRVNALCALARSRQTGHLIERASSASRLLYRPRKRRAAPYTTIRT